MENQFKQYQVIARLFSGDKKKFLVIAFDEESAINTTLKADKNIKRIKAINEIRNPAEQL